MKEKTWNYLNNPFESALKNSYVKLYAFAANHKEKLFSLSEDSFIATLYHDYFMPSFTQYKSLYNQLNELQANYHAQTEQLTNLMANLSGKKIGRWAVQIQYVYENDSQTYLYLLGKGRKSFQNGSYTNRIQAVEDLLNRVKKYDLLSKVQTDIQTFLNHLQETYSLQHQLAGEIKIISHSLKLQKEALLQSLHHVYTGLCWHYKHDIQTVACFYELSYLKTYASTSENNENENLTP